MRQIPEDLPAPAEEPISLPGPPGFTDPPARQSEEHLPLPPPPSLQPDRATPARKRKSRWDDSREPLPGGNTQAALVLPTASSTAQLPVGTVCFFEKQIELYLGRDCLFRASLQGSKPFPNF